MAEAGKHIWIEKPVGLTADDARAVADAVDARPGCRGRSGSTTATPRPSRRPELVARGELGAITHVRFRLFSDYAATRTAR